MNAAYVASTLLAAGEDKKSGPIGFAVILVLCVVCYFLFKSMSKHLRRVREEFPRDQQPSSDAAEMSLRDEPPGSAPTDSAPRG